MAYKFLGKIYNTKEEVYQDALNRDIDLEIFSKYFSKYVNYKELLKYAIDQKNFKYFFNSQMVDAIKLYIDENIEVGEDNE